MNDRTTRYAEDVANGLIIAGPWVRLACARHLRDLENAHERGLAWCPERAEYVFKFFECLTLGDDQHSGKSFELAPAQAFIVGSLYGWINTQDGSRRFGHAYIEEGKGNGKTPLAAGLGLFGLVGDRQDGAEIYSAAVSREQAGICFRDATRFVEASRYLSRQLEVGAKNIAYHRTGGYFRPISSEGRGLDGKRVSIALIDEVHEHPNATVVDKMAAGVKGRANGLIFEITNSGYDRHSVCWEHHEYSIKVLQNVIEDDAWFAYVCALDEGDDWMSEPACWVKANPLLGVSISEKYLAKQVQRARDMPSMQNIVARLNFCVWTEQASRWMPLDAWDENGDPIDAELLRHRECFGGLDLASVADLAALCWVFPPRDAGDKWVFLPRFWCPKDGIRRRSQQDGVPYDDWAREGLIAATDGNIVDYAFIKAQIHADAEHFVVREIAYDRWNATQLVTELTDDGFKMVAFGQGFASMAAPMRELMKLIVDRRCAHGGNKVLRWMASNVSAKQDPAGNEKPDKSTSGDKIDGIVALLMGLGRAIVTPDEAKSVYETRGILTL